MGLHLGRGFHSHVLDHQSFQFIVDELSTHWFCTHIIQEYKAIWVLKNDLLVYSDDGFPQVVVYQDFSNLSCVLLRQFEMFTVYEITPPKL
jgi:hypothetical protein